MADRLPPLNAEAKAALRDVLEERHPQDRDLIALLDEVDTLTEHRNAVTAELDGLALFAEEAASNAERALREAETGLATLHAQLDAALERECKAQEDRDAARTEFRDLMVCAAVLIDRAGGVIEVGMADAQRLEAMRLVRTATAARVVWSLQARP